MKLSIIIVSYNTKDITDQCLHSIYEAEWRSPYEVIVVDNNSADGSCDMIRNKYPEVKLIANSTNNMFSIANNQGAKMASGDYLLLLNSDTIVEGDNLQRMIDYFETLPEKVICIGPKILNKDGSLQSCGHPQWGKKHQHYISLYRLNKIFPLYLISPLFDFRADVTRRTGWVTGCCMMVRRKQYLDIGGLNENLVFYGEEPEFGFRSDKKGFITKYYANAHIIHLGGQSTKKETSTNNSFDKDMRQYLALLRETIGFNKGLKTNKRVLRSLKIKRLFYKDRQHVDKLINHENNVIAYFKNLELRGEL